MSKNNKINYKIVIDGVNIRDSITNKTILENLENKEIDIPNLCRKGQCGCCKIHLIKGKVFQEKNVCLSKAELNEDIILACCSYSKSDIEIELY